MLDNFKKDHGVVCGCHLWLVVCSFFLSDYNTYPSPGSRSSTSNSPNPYFGITRRNMKEEKIDYFF